MRMRCQRGMGMALFLALLAGISVLSACTAERTAPADTIVVKDVAKDPLPDDPQLADAIRLGSQIVRDTGTYAAEYVGNDLACTNCHINAGQQVGAMPFVGIAQQFPAYNGRAGRVISLEDRIRGCFLRSMNGTPPPYDSEELLAVSAYISWLSEGHAVGANPPWRGKNRIAEEARIPIEQLDPEAGKALYLGTCASCHGADGQGVAGAYPPVWGPGSYNDGAGAARVYTLAGFLRYAMPLSAPGSLTDEQAQQIAAYLNSQERPVYAGKAKDYPDGKIPADGVYYPQLYPEHPLQP